MKKIFVAITLLTLACYVNGQNTPDYGKITAIINGIPLEGRLIEAHLRPIGWYLISNDKTLWIENNQKQKDIDADPDPVWKSGREISFVFLMNDSSKISLFVEWDKAFNRKPATVQIMSPSIEVVYQAKLGSPISRGRFILPGHKPTSGRFTLWNHDAVGKTISGVFSVVIPQKTGPITLDEVAFSNICYLAGTVHCK